MRSINIISGYRVSSLIVEESSFGHIVGGHALAARRVVVVEVGGVHVFNRHVGIQRLLVRLGLAAEVELRVQLLDVARQLGRAEVSVQRFLIA